MRNAQHEYEPSAHALERLASAVSPGEKGGIMLRAAILPRGPQDETTADIEVHLYGVHRAKLEAQIFEPLGPRAEPYRHRIRDRDGSNPRPGNNDDREGKKRQ